MLQKDDRLKKKSLMYYSSLQQTYHPSITEKSRMLARRMKHDLVCYEDPLISM